MKQEEIIEIFDCAIDEYLFIKKLNTKEKFGYITAIMDIFSQLLNYEKGENND